MATHRIKDDVEKRAYEWAKKNMTGEQLYIGLTFSDILSNMLQELGF